MKKLLITALVSAGLITGFSAMAGDKNKHFGKGMHNPGKIFKKLDLSDSQEQQIKTIFKEVKGENSYETRGEHRQQMQTITQAEVLDEVALGKLAQEKADKVKARIIKMATAKHKAWLVLTPEQRSEAKEIMAKRQERMDKKRKKGDKNHDHD